MVSRGAKEKTAAAANELLSWFRSTRFCLFGFFGCDDAKTDVQINGYYQKDLTRASDLRLCTRRHQQYGGRLSNNVENNSHDGTDRYERVESVMRLVKDCSQT